MRSSNFEVRNIQQYTKIDNNSTIIPFIEILQQNNILIIVNTFLENLLINVQLFLLKQSM